MGLALGAMGLFLTGMVPSARCGSVDSGQLMGVPAGLMFVFAGIFLALPPSYAKWRGLFAALLVSCFALTFDWVAFAPGERRFSGSVLGTSFVPAEVLGRTLFGVCAII